MSTSDGHLNQFKIHLTNGVAAFKAKVDENERFPVFEQPKSRRKEETSAITVDKKPSVCESSVASRLAPVINYDNNFNYGSCPLFISMKIEQYRFVTVHQIGSYTDIARYCPSLEDQMDKFERNYIRKLSENEESLAWFNELINDKEEAEKRVKGMREFIDWSKRVERLRLVKETKVSQKLFLVLDGLPRPHIDYVKEVSASIRGAHATMSSRWAVACSNFNRYLQRAHSKLAF